MIRTEVAPGVIVCRHYNWPIRRVYVCPVCHERHRIIGTDRGAWYGILWTCCGCGDSWADGEILPRPFQRGWRQKAVAEARRRWVAAGPYDRAAHRAWIAEQIGREDGAR